MLTESEAIYSLDLASAYGKYMECTDNIRRSKPFPVVFVHPSSCQNGSHPTESQGRLFLEFPTARQPQYCMATNASEWRLKDLGAGTFHRQSLHRESMITVTLTRVDVSMS